MAWTMDNKRHHIAIHFGLPTGVVIILGYMGMNDLINDYPTISIVLLSFCTIGVVYGVIVSSIDTYKEKQEIITQQIIKQFSYLINPESETKETENEKEKRCYLYATMLTDRNIPVTMLQDVKYMMECRAIIKELGARKGIKKIKDYEQEILSFSKFSW